MNTDHRTNCINHTLHAEESLQRKTIPSTATGAISTKLLPLTWNSLSLLFGRFSTLSCRTTQRSDPRTTPGPYQQTAPLQGLLLPHRTPAGTGGKGAWSEVQPQANRGLGVLWAPRFTRVLAPTPSPFKIASDKTGKRSLRNKSKRTEKPQSLVLFFSSCHFIRYIY